MHGHCLLTLNKKAPEHLTKLSFSAAERLRAKGERAAEWSPSGEVTEWWQRGQVYFYLPHICLRCPYYQNSPKHLKIIIIIKTNNQTKQTKQNTISRAAHIDQILANWPARKFACTTLARSISAGGKAGG